jgi:hypothetical protein
MAELLQDAPVLADRRGNTPSEVLEQFLVRLTTTPLAEWHRAAMAAPSPALAAATRALAAASRTPDALYASWLVRDHVETACHRFDSPDGRSICPSPRVADVRTATQRAALALLLRGSLREDHVIALSGGFASWLMPSPSAPPP